MTLTFDGMIGFGMFWPQSKCLFIKCLRRLDVSPCHLPCQSWYTGSSIAVQSELQKHWELATAAIWVVVSNIFLCSSLFGEMIQFD